MMENTVFLFGKQWFLMSFRLFSSPYSSPITIIGTFFTENPLKKSEKLTEKSRKNQWFLVIFEADNIDSGEESKVPNFGAI